MTGRTGAGGDIAGVLKIELYFYLAMCVGELKVLMQSSFLHRSEYALPPEERLSSPPIMAARWFSHQHKTRAGDYNNYYMVCLPISTFVQTFAKVFMRHTVQKPPRYYFAEPTPMSAESFGGIEVYSVGDHLNMLDYCSLTKKYEGSTDGCFLSAVVIYGLLRQLHMVAPPHVPLRSDGRLPC